LKRSIAELAAVIGSWSTRPGPLYLRLAEAIEAAIARGEIAQHVPLPAERRLASELGVSRGTVVAAYRILQRRGLVTSRRGSRRRIASAPTPAPAASDEDLIVALGRSPLFRGLVEAQPAEYDLASAPATGSDALPVLRRAVMEVAEDLAPLAASHGYDPLGLPSLRAAIAADLTRAALETAPGQVLITNGAQQALALIAATFARQAVIAVEDPASLGALDALLAADARLVPVPVDEQGLRVELLRELVPQRPRLLYVTPTVQNPTGVLMSTARRRELIVACAEMNLPVIEDLSLAPFALRQPPAALSALDRDDAVVITVGSLSNVVWGGLRVGWIRASRPVIALLARFKVATDIGTSLLAQAVAGRLFETLDGARARQRQRAETALAEATTLLAHHLPTWAWRRPDGGPFLWIELPHGSALEFAVIAQRHGIALVPGPVVSTSGAHARRLRLQFVHDSPVLREAIPRLAHAWSSYSKGASVRELTVLR
jgi:DNA-binding transcriptional MocR family regulator